MSEHRTAAATAQAERLFAKTTAAPVTEQSKPAEPRYHIAPEGQDRPAFTASAADLDGALQAAWQLQRHYEAPIVIEDHSEPGQPVVARVNVEWCE